MFDNQFVCFLLLTTCNKLVISRLSQIVLVHMSPLQNVNRLVATCAFLVVFGCVMSCGVVVVTDLIVDWI